MDKEIIASASALFLQYGYKAVTMDDIAEHMRISKKTIYLCFNDKTALVRYSVLHVFETVKDKIINVETTTKNPIDALYEIKKIAVQVLGNKDKSPQYQLQKYYPKIFAELKEKQFAFMQDCIQENLNRGLERNLFRETIDVGFISRIYFNGMMAIKDPSLFPLQKFSMNELMDFYLEYHLRGICTVKGIEVLENELKNNAI